MHGTYLGKTQAGLEAWSSFIRSCNALAFSNLHFQTLSTYRIAAGLLGAGWAGIVCGATISRLSGLDSLDACKQQHISRAGLSAYQLRRLVAQLTVLASVEELQQEALVKLLAAGSRGTGRDGVNGLDAAKGAGQGGGSGNKDGKSSGVHRDGRLRIYF